MPGPSPRPGAFERLAVGQRTAFRGHGAGTARSARPLPAGAGGTRLDVIQQSGMVLLEHATLLATANQALASGTPSLEWDRLAGPPHGRRGFTALALPTRKIPIDRAGLLIVHMYLQLLDEREVTVGGVLLQGAASLDLLGTDGHGPQVDERFPGVLARADDTLELFLEHASGGALWGDPNVLWGDPNVLWGGGSLVVEHGWVDLSLWREALGATPAPAAPATSPTLGTADVSQPNVQGRAVDVGGVCLTLSATGAVPEVAYTRATSVDAGQFNQVDRVDINMPLGHGGTLVAVVMCGLASSGDMTAAGWTRVVNLSDDHLFDIHGGVFTKDGDGTEGTSQEFVTNEPARMWFGAVVRVTGVDAVDAAAAIFDNNLTTDPSVAEDVPSPSPAADNALALWAAVVGNASTDDAGPTVIADGATQLEVASVGTDSQMFHAALWGAEVTIP